MPRAKKAPTKKRPTTRRGKRPKSAVVEKEEPVEVKKPPSPVAPHIRMTGKLVEESENDVEDGVVSPDLFDGAPDPFEEAPEDDLRPDRNLTDAQKAEFKRILNSKMDLNERATALVELSGFRDTKRAAVALRAIQIINEITEVDKPGTTGEAPSMFQLPEDSEISVKVEVADK